MKAIAKRAAIKSTRHAAVVKRIVDGDTLILDIYIGVTVLLPLPSISDTWLGMGLSIDPGGMLANAARHGARRAGGACRRLRLVLRKARARLYKFDAAEIKTLEGKVARDKLAEALPLGTEIVVEVHGRDKYGKWLVTPILSECCTPRCASCR